MKRFGVFFFGFFLLSCDMEATFEVGNANYFPMQAGETWQYDYQMIHQKAIEILSRKGILTWKVQKQSPDGTGGITFEVQETLEAIQKQIRKDGLTPAPDSSLRFTNKLYFHLKEGALWMARDKDRFGPYQVLLADKTPEKIAYGNLVQTNGRLTFQRDRGLIAWDMSNADPYQAMQMSAVRIINSIP